MPSSAERGLRFRGLALLLRGLAFALILALAQAPVAWAQDEPTSTPPEWEGAVIAAEAAVADPDSDTAALGNLRDRLQRLRSAAIEFEAAAAARVADVNARLQALGPPPAEGAAESPEIAERRARIGAELSVAQVPVIEAQDFERRAEALVRDIDRVVRARFSAELRSRGPSPLWPGYWVDAAEAIVANLRAARQDASATLADPEKRATLVRRVPLDLVLASVGIALAIVLRLRLVGWVEERLSRANNPKTIALLVNLRNFSRLILPAAGAGLLFAALDPARLVNPGRESGLFQLPPFLIALIAASWLGSSLFAPRLPAYRLAPVDDAVAARGARLVMALGGLVAADYLLSRYVAPWDLTPAEAATLAFPLFVIGGVLLWRFSRILREVTRRIVARDRGAPSGERTGALTLSVLRLVERAIWLIAFAAPALAAAGYLAAAHYLTFSAILTLALLGTGVVLYDLATTTLGAISDRGAAAREIANDGLVPVAVATLLVCAAAPPLALIWGARSSDISDVWYVLRDGVTFAGMRVSLGTIVTFALVFGVIYGLSRVLQSLLRNSVLPRTRMDAGGRNAVLAGVGYVGFFIAVVAAVSSTGIDLTSLAVVAGALSVGIGFGLQNIVSNFVSGIILLVERPIKEGDWIEVGGFAGYVRAISVRSTEIETFDRASVILPNSDLIAGSVLNRTHSGMSGRIQVPVAVDMDSDVRLVERILSEIAETHPLVLPEPQPRVLLMEIGPDALLFEIRCWLRDVNFSLSARSDMNFDIVERLNKAGIRVQPHARDARVPPAPPVPEGPPGDPAA